MNDSVIRKAVKGEIPAFKLIFDFYLPRMRPVCLRYSSDDIEAENILQESFITIYNNLRSYRSEESFEGWIRKMVIRHAFNRHKKNHAITRCSFADDLDKEIIQELIPASIEHQEPVRLLRIVNELPEFCRTVFTLYVIDDFSHKEISELLGVTQERSQLYFLNATIMINKLLLSQLAEEKISHKQQSGI